jgi:hypothetical protein
VSLLLLLLLVVLLLVLLGLCSGSCRQQLPTTLQLLQLLQQRQRCREDGAHHCRTGACCDLPDDWNRTQHSKDLFIQTPILLLLLTGS